jgi:hypothetical protein
VVGIVLVIRLKNFVIQGGFRVRPYVTFPFDLFMMSNFVYKGLHKKAEESFFFFDRIVHLKSNGCHWALISFSCFGIVTVVFQGALKESQRERERVEREREQLERRLEEAEGRGNTKLQINQLKVREN